MEEVVYFHDFCTVNCRCSVFRGRERTDGEQRCTACGGHTRCPCSWLEPRAGLAHQQRQLAGLSNKCPSEAIRLTILELLICNCAFIPWLFVVVVVICFKGCNIRLFARKPRTCWAAQGALGDVSFDCNNCADGRAGLLGMSKRVFQGHHLWLGKVAWAAWEAEAC